MSSASRVSPWLVLIAATGSLSMVMLDSTVVGVALPSIQHDLSLTTAERGWIVSSYLLAMAALMALGGRTGDRLGYVLTFRVGILGFGAASVMCGLSESAATLIFWRVMQAVCVALMQPAATAMVVSSFPRERLGRVMAIYIGIPLLFLAGGPVLGGAITEWAGWRWIFLPNALITLAAIAMTFGIGLRNEPGRPRAFHPFAPVLLILSLSALGIGLQVLGDDIDSAAWSAPLVGGGAVAFLAFLAWQYRSPRPLLALTVFHDRVLLRNALLIAFAQLALVGQGIFGPIYLQVAMGMSPFESGMAALPLVAPNVVVIYFAGRAYDRYGGRLPALFGSIALFAGLLIEAVGMWQLSYTVIAVGMGCIGCGIPFILNPSNTDGMARAPADKRAEVSGLLQTGRQFGGAFGITTVIASVHLWTSILQPGTNSSEDQSLAVAHAISITFGTQALAALIVMWLATGLPRGAHARSGGAGASA
ncbi:MAG: MFS transporter [Planctomycetota bacterium]|nr:MFS transporter [Planctomycetota bacterium]MDA1105341.1 MFS transporter [Planctomycetota bacterium]